MRLPGTLSARIVVGLAILIAASGTFAVSTVVYANQIDHAIRVINGGYLQLTLATRDLADRQDDLWNYLRDKLPEETSAQRLQVAMRIRRTRDNRLNKVETILEQFHEAEGVDGWWALVNEQERLARIRAEITRTQSLFRDLEAKRLRVPKNAHLASEADDGTTSNYREILRSEGLLKGETTRLRDRLSMRLRATSERLGDFSHDVRVLQGVSGVTVLVVGAVVIVFALVTLRPLRTLRAGVARIASGDYDGQLTEAGPSDIAELAAEFNAMGQAIKERELELVRTERFATVGKMASMITHEVRNPLSSIGLNAELLEEELAGLPPARAAEGRALIRAITGEVDRLTEMTESYLRFARLPKPKLGEVLIGPLVVDVVEFARESVEHRGVELIAEIDDATSTIRADEGQVKQVLMNLIRNAADAVESTSGRVLVRTRTATTNSTDFVVVDVVDNGAGVPVEMRDKLFEPLATTKSQGTGLGLALSQEIVREHGGKVAFTSTAENGTTFSVFLPV